MQLVQWPLWSTYGMFLLPLVMNGTSIVHHGPTWPPTALTNQSQGRQQFTYSITGSIKVWLGRKTLIIFQPEASVQGNHPCNSEWDGPVPEVPTDYLVLMAGLASYHHWGALVLPHLQLTADKNSDQNKQTFQIRFPTCTTSKPAC